MIEEPPVAGSLHSIYTDALLAVVTVGVLGLAGTVAAIMSVEAEY